MFFAVVAMILLTSFSVDALSLQEVAAGLNNPVFVTFAPGDSTRLFVLEQPGRIRIVKNASLLTAPFLDITAEVGFGGERGLLGLAFHPDYQSNGFFYLNYTDNSGATNISRFQVSGNPDLADGGSEFTILVQPQPFSNHNGGMIAFGPLDDYLYIGFGDGGSGGDPLNLGQSDSTFLGKMLRIDIDGASPYAIPASNPYFGAVDTLPEIWAFGVRNPWRFSFDRDNGDLYIADVGQNIIEEIDYQPASSAGGENYGWRLKEGSDCFNPSSGCDPGGLLVDPIHEYNHGGSPHRCSVTGGYVYRGCAIPELKGAYLFGDYCSGNIWSFKYDGSNLTQFTDHTAELGTSGFDLSSFGEDYFGELYILELSQGKVFKIIPDGPPASCFGCCDFPGDFNDDGALDISDLSGPASMVAFMFQSGPPPPCPQEGDFNGDGNQDVSDLSGPTSIVAYLFLGGPPPICA